MNAGNAGMGILPGVTIHAHSLASILANDGTVHQIWVKLRLGSSMGPVDVETVLEKRCVGWS